MHMADALLSPAVGGVMWAASAGTIAFCSARLAKEPDDRKVPLMGVLGAFLFAAQMINFSIPGTGSSGHLSGGLLLTVLLGPCAAFLTIASVLVVQALFFADGGLLALGCNIFNIGFLPAFVAFPVFYRKLIGNDPSRRRLTAVTMLSAVIGLQLGSFAVLMETLCSGISSFPFATFAWLMQPIHLAIGVVEGGVTAAVICFVRQARPEMLHGAVAAPCRARRHPGLLPVCLLALALVTAGVFSRFSCKDPDGLEWSIAGASGKAGLKSVGQGVQRTLADLQQQSAWFPDYDFRDGARPVAVPGPAGSLQEARMPVGTGIAGIVGTLLTLLLAFCVGLLLKRRGPDAS